VAPSVAQERVVHDALLAVGARRGPEGESADVRGAVRGVLAASVLGQIWSDVRIPPLTEDEIARWSKRRWVDLDRPEGFRTVHAVAMVAPGDDPTQRDRARELADDWLAAAAKAAALARRLPAPVRQRKARFRFDPQSTVDPAATEFMKALRGVDAQGQKHQVERLPVVAADGRVIDYGAPQGSLFVQDFCAAAAKLRRRGDLSPVVETQFGYHVILLLERLPALELSPVQQRDEIREDIWKERARNQHGSLVRRLRTEAKVDVATNADALLGLVSVEP
jgi:peptidyl-prolyl cis-trans isomerase C